MHATGGTERILIVGSRRTGSLEGAYAHALRQLQLPVVDQFDLEAPGTNLANTRIMHRLTMVIQSELASRSLFRYLKIWAEHYTLIIVIKGMRLLPTWLAKCKAITPNSIWLNINPDDPFNSRSRGATNSSVRDSIKLYDVYATWNLKLVTVIRAAGCAQVVHLPFGYDAAEHYPSQALDSEFEDAIAFVGAWDKQRETILTAVADLPLRIFGYGWERVKRQSSLCRRIQPDNIYGDNLRRVITSARASINILRPQNLDTHNMRTFEIPAMRGLMVTTRSPDQEHYFPDGEACLMYADSAELRRVLIAVLRGEIDADHMRVAGWGKCHDHSYTERARMLLRAIHRYRRDGQVV